MNTLIETYVIPGDGRYTILRDTPESPYIVMRDGVLIYTAHTDSNIGLMFCRNVIHNHAVGNNTSAVNAAQTKLDEVKLVQKMLANDERFIIHYLSQLWDDKA